GRQTSRPLPCGSRGRGAPAAWVALGNLDRALGESHPVAVDDARQRLTGAVAGAERHEQRGEVLGARMRVADGGRAVHEVGQFVDVTAVERLVRPGVELRRPCRGWCVEPEISQEGQPVGQEAAADDEHALVSQWPVAPIVSGALSQWAATISTAVGRGTAFARAASWATQSGSSTSGGAPRPMSTVGMRSESLACRARSSTALAATCAGSSGALAGC